MNIPILSYSYSVLHVIVLFKFMLEAMIEGEYLKIYKTVIGANVVCMQGRK